MEFFRAAEADFAQIAKLHSAYKKEIGEAAPTKEELCALQAAIERGDILFYACRDNGGLIACCSVSPVFSTFDYRRSGVFEDFYVIPERRGSGVARSLVSFAFRESGVGTLTVGSADCDRDMYRALGFSVPLGSLLAMDCPPSEEG